MGLASSVRLCLAAAACCIFISKVQYLVPCLPVLATATDSEIDTKSVDALEKQLFMQSFSEEKMPDRLSRIEKRVFGTEMQGTPQERLARLQGASGVGSEADLLTKSNQGNQNNSAVAPAQGGSSVSQPSNNVKSNTNSTSKSIDHEAAKEREKESVQAAEEQEINSLLAQGVTAWRDHNFQLAMDRFKQVVRLDPHNSQAYFSLGIIYETNGDFQNALNNYEKASKEKPDDKDYLDAVAQAEKKLATTSTQIDSKQSELKQMSQQALADYNRGDYLSALDLYKQIDQKYPNQAINKYNIGSVYLLMRVPEKALEYYQKAHQLSPGDQKFSEAADKLKATMQQNNNQVNSNSPRADVSARQQPKESGKKHHESANETPKPASLISIYGLEIKGGSHEVRITAVDPSGRAARVGLRSGDIIKSVNGNIVESVEDMNRILSGCNPIKQLQLIIQHEKRLNQFVI